MEDRQLIVVLEDLLKKLDLIHVAQIQFTKEIQQMIHKLDLINSRL